VRAWLRDALEGVLAHPRAHQDVAEQPQERLGVVPVHLPDEDGLVAAHLHPEARGHRVERLLELAVGEGAGPALRHQRGREVRQALPPRRVVGAARVEGDAHVHQRSRGRLRDDAERLPERLDGPGRRRRLVTLGGDRLRRRGRRGGPARDEQQPEDEGAPHEGSSSSRCDSVTTKRRRGTR
jgi:hypothetical protein